MNIAPESTCRDSDGLFQRARQGDRIAWEELFEHCYSKVRRTVGRKLNQIDRRLRTIFDSCDLTHDVFHSLLRKSDNFEFQSIDEIQAFLTVAAKQKVIDAYRKQHRDCRDLNRLLHLGDLKTPDGDQAYEPMAADPTPSQWAQQREAREQIIGKHSGFDREVLELRAEDYTNEEIAEKTGSHVRKIQRTVKKASDSWRASGEGRDT